MFRYLLLAVIPAVIFACCSPDQWEGMQLISYAARQPDGTGYRVDVMGMAHVDTTKHIAVYNQTVTQMDGTMFQQWLMQDYQKKIQYYVRDNKCEKMNLTTDLDISCISKDATVMEHSHIGAGNSMVMTTMYRHMTNNTLNYITVTDDGCIPVLYESSGTQPDGNHDGKLVHRATTPMTYQPTSRNDFVFIAQSKYDTSLSDPKYLKFSWEANTCKPSSCG